MPSVAPCSSPLPPVPSASTAAAQSRDACSAVARGCDGVKPLTPQQPMFALFAVSVVIKPRRQESCVVDNSDTISLPAAATLFCSASIEQELSTIHKRSTTSLPGGLMKGSQPRPVKSP